MAKMVIHVYAKARAFVDALAKMPRGVYAITPRGHFARDFNILRKLALDAEPDLDERLLGKYIPVRRTASGEEVSDASFVEIETYARQILEQLALLLPPDGVPRPVVEEPQVGRGRMAPDRAGKPWDPGEDDELAAAFDAGKSVGELAAIHRRTEYAIESRLIRLGRLTVVPATGVGPDPTPPAAEIPQVVSETGTRRLPSAAPPTAQPSRLVSAWKPARPRAGKSWTPEEDGALLREFDAGLSPEEIAERRGRGVLAVETRLFKLGRDATARSEIPASAKPGDPRYPRAGVSAE